MSPTRENERGTVGQRGPMVMQQQTQPRAQTAAVVEEVKQEADGGWGSVDLFNT